MGRTNPATPTVTSKTPEDLRRNLFKGLVEDRVTLGLEIVEMPPLGRNAFETLGVHGFFEDRAVFELFGSAAGVVAVRTFRKFVVTGRHRQLGAGLVDQ